MSTEGHRITSKTPGVINQHRGIEPRIDYALRSKTDKKACATYEGVLPNN
jgi:hypothetical protein